MITKNKTDTNITLEGESVKHTKRVVSTAGVDVQTVGKDMAYTARAETRWKNRAMNKTAAGISLAKVAGCGQGVKLENRPRSAPAPSWWCWRRDRGARRRAGRQRRVHAGLQGFLGHHAPLDRRLAMHWRNDTALGVNGTSQFNLTPDTAMTVRANINSRG